MRNRSLVLIVFLSFVLGVIVMHVRQSYCQNLVGTGQALSFAPGAMKDEYTLIAPYKVTSSENERGEVDLLDSAGRVVHSWQMANETLMAYLEPNGHIFAAMTPFTDLSAAPGGGTTGVIAEYDWNGKELWRYEDPEMTHDFDVLPDGSIAYIRWDKTPASYASRIIGGIKNNTDTSWSNEIVVVNHDKQIVWNWHLYDHIDPTEYPLNAFTPRLDIAHTNSIRYVKDNPLTHTAAYLISVRHISTVFLIDAKTGNIIWRSPKGMFAMQHDATLLPSGNILVFDNGLFRPLPYGVFLSSRVVEVDLHTNAITWEYKGGATGIPQSLFASSLMGGAQRLENGNTLVTDSVEGKILEVDQAGKVLWSYANDFRAQTNSGRVIFKSRAYDPGGTQWADSVRSMETFYRLMCSK